jgi:hypothetical protein
VVLVVDVADGLVDGDAVARAEKVAGAAMMEGSDETVGRDFRARQTELVLARYDDLEGETKKLIIAGS